MLRLLCYRRDECNIFIFIIGKTVLFGALALLRIFFQICLCLARFLQFLPPEL
jgi:hypothetical protein